METITIQNVGPVADHTLPVAPGITVLTGENEAGKSTCIAAVAALAGRDVDLSVRDGSKSGLVAGCGATLVVARKTLRSGDLDAETMETKLDVSKLVDPQIKQAAAATKTRIRALLSLTNARLDIADFASILPPEMGSEISAADQDDDPVEMAGKVKRRMEKKARDVETEANLLEGAIKAAAERLRDQNLAGEADEAALQRSHTDAAKAQARIESQAEAAASKAKEIAAAKAAVAKAEADAGESLDAAREMLAQCEAEADDAAREVATAAKLVDTITAEIEAAKARLAASQQQHKAAISLLTARKEMATNQANHVSEVQQRLESIAQLRQLAASTAPAAPSTEEATAAQKALDAAQAAIERGAVLRELRKLAAEKEAKHKLWVEKCRLAVVFRNAAQSTDRVLSESLQCDTLRVIEGDLHYCEGERSEPYARLSDGKRWQVALRELARAHRVAHPNRLCILPVPQQAWEGLTDHNRAAVYQAAVEANVAIVTAEKASGKPLSSYRWEPAAQGVHGTGGKPALAAAT